MADRRIFLKTGCNASLNKDLSNEPNSTDPYRWTIPLKSSTVLTNIETEQGIENNISFLSGRYTETLTNNLPVEKHKNLFKLFKYNFNISYCTVCTVG
jgi:hypothetical protein